MLNPTILTSGDETCTVLVDGAQVRVRYSYPSRVHDGAGDVIHTGESHVDALAYAETQVLPEVRGDGFRDVTDDPLSAASLAAIFSSEYRPRVDPDGAVYYGAGVPLCMGVVGEGVDGARGRTFEDLRLVTAAELPAFPLHGSPLPDIAPDLLRVATALVALALANSVADAKPAQVTQADDNLAMTDTQAPADHGKPKTMDDGLTAELAAVLAGHQWHRPPGHPNIWRISAHRNHNHHHACAICTGDLAAVASVTMAWLAERCPIPGAEEVWRVSYQVDVVGALLDRTLGPFSNEQDAAAAAEQIAKRGEVIHHLRVQRRYHTDWVEPLPAEHTEEVSTA